MSGPRFFRGIDPGSVQALLDEQAAEGYELDILEEHIIVTASTTMQGPRSAFWAVFQPPTYALAEPVEDPAFAHTEAFDWKGLPAERKVQIIELMGFTPMGASHQPDCPYALDSGNRCNCVPPPTWWNAPQDVLVHRGETYEERKAAKRRPIPATER